MRILIAPDSFKESLSALKVSKAIKSGFSKVFFKLVTIYFHWVMVVRVLLRV